MTYKKIAITVFAFSTLQVFGGSDVNGVHNFMQVNEHVYRGAQPTEEGFRALAKLGVKTIVDLRGSDQWSSEESLVKAAGMKYVHIPMNGMERPSEKNMAKALVTLNSSDAWPVFVHCKRGADRTGTVIACYRITHDNWDNRKALHEAKSMGMSPFQIAMHHYIKEYQVPVTETASDKLAPKSVPIREAAAPATLVQ